MLRRVASGGRDCMAFLSERDRATVEALVYDPAAEPSFELLKGCLIWRDEIPINISSEGYDRVCDLWAARSCLHRGVPMAPVPIAGDRFKNAWEQAQREGLQWPGFRRVTLSETDRAYLDRSLAELETGEY